MKRKRTVPARGAQSVLADARHLVALVRTHRAKLEAYDVGKARKVADDATIGGWEDDITIAEAAAAGQRITISTSVQATAAEIRARTAVYDELMDLRGDVELRLDDHPEVAAALGLRRAPRAWSTTGLIEVAQTAGAAYATGEHDGLLGEAGVTAERMERLAALCSALVAADTRQKVSQSASASRTISKREALRRVVALAVRIRKIAGVVFRKDRTLRGEFKSRLPRHTPKPRKPKRATPPETTEQTNVGSGHGAVVGGREE